MNLSEVSAEDLANELAKRPDLLNQDGIMSEGLYKILCKISVIPCTDGIALRRNGRRLEAMAILRGTGVFKGRYCSVGGRVKRGETIENCLRRQFRTDLGCEIRMLRYWKRPADIGQMYPLENPLTDPWPEEFGPEDGKHVISCFYPVELRGEPTLGSTKHGGQEAQKIEWFSMDTLPDPEYFGYDQHPKFVACLKAGESLI